MEYCKICGRPLNETQWRNNKNFKSCPKCSEENGQEHVYYEYPRCFGTSNARITPNNPDGAQSYCVPCRGNGESYPNARLCSEFNQG